MKLRILYLSNITLLILSIILFMQNNHVKNEIFQLKNQNDSLLNISKKNNFTNEKYFSNEIHEINKKTPNLSQKEKNEKKLTQNNQEKNEKISKIEKSEVGDNELKNIDKKNGFLELINEKGIAFVYVGELADGMANGYGVANFENGNVYKGQWKNNTKHGQGVFTWVGGERYEGQFIDNFKNGQGKYFWKNGEIYDGEWKNELRHGLGTIFKKNGQIKFKGKFEEDQFVKKVDF